MRGEEELQIEKKELIEQLGVQLEKKNQLAPVAARILATLILTGQQGVTFDEFVQELNTSKSTISTHLDHLQISRKIRYFTKPGDRKRYFIVNPDLIVEVINETLASWETEKCIQEKILKYKKEKNKLNVEKNLPLFDLSLQENLLIYLNEATTAINKLKSRIITNNN